MTNETLPIGTTSDDVYDTAEALIFEKKKAKLAALLPLLGKKQPLGPPGIPGQPSVPIPPVSSCHSCASCTFPAVDVLVPRASQVFGDASSDGCFKGSKICLMARHLKALFTGSRLLL